MSAAKRLLPKAYRITTPDQAQDFYQDWADTYDQEVTETGYATPPRCAEALAKFTPDKSAAVLDFGCGTGLSGVALKAEGFGAIDGCDLSDAMLEKAAARENVYRHLTGASPDDPFPATTGTYAAISAMGVIASGHAPAETIDAALAALPTDGLLVFSLNDHTLQDPSFNARVSENIDTGMARLLFRENGAHLPGIGMTSMVYVLQKA